MPTEVEQLRQVLAAKDEFIKRLLLIVECCARPGELTHLPQGAWDQLVEGEYVPPHAHLMMVLEARGWKRTDGKLGWKKGRLFIPLWWVWGVHPQAIIWDVVKVIGLLQNSAGEWRGTEADGAHCQHIDQKFL